jgi:broad specificity phosphatase PhoE
VTTILLARHGESDWNAAGRWQGHVDRPLTGLGRRQAEELGAFLADISLDAAYASDLRRAWETAEIAVAGRGVEVIRLSELREVDVGSWSGLSRDEVEARYPEGVERWRAGGRGWEGGESYEEMAARVVAAVRRIAAEHVEATVLVVAHGGSVRAVKAAAVGVTLHEHRLRHPFERNGALSRVAVENGRLRLLG